MLLSVDDPVHEIASRSITAWVQNTDDAAALWKRITGQPNCVLQAVDAHPEIPGDITKTLRLVLTQGTMSQKSRFEGHLARPDFGYGRQVHQGSGSQVYM